MCISLSLSLSLYIYIYMYVYIYIYIYIIMSGRWGAGAIFNRILPSRNDAIV